ncbi:MAG: DNA alkylation repair protein, partial [Chloroflexi bacterium RBG_16_57_11]
MPSQVEELLSELHALASPENVVGMAHYGINTHGTLGISIYELRRIAKTVQPSHELAEELWASGIHEARILASYLERPDWVSEEQMERWVLDFDSWDVCDQVVELFAGTPFAYAKVIAWSQRTEEFVKRAAFALIAELAAHDKNASDEKMAQFFPVIVGQATDGRNFVKKAVNWALRNIGKRNRELNRLAIETARQIQQIDDRTARWIAT